jgi:hypothetical protein
MARVPSLDHLPDKIRESCTRLAGLQEDAAKERHERNRLIVAAVDQAGIPIRVVARYAGMSPGHVMRVLGTAEED